MRVQPGRGQGSSTQAAGGPTKIEITYNADGGHKDWVDATCNQLKANLGVECVGIAEPKFADLLTKVEKKQPVGMFRMGWVMDYPSMENYLGPLYITNGSSNYYGYSNPEFDKPGQGGLGRARPRTRRSRSTRQAEDILAKDMPVIPLRFGQNIFGHSTKVKNVEMDLFNRVDLIKIEASAEPDGQRRRPAAGATGSRAAASAPPARRPGRTSRIRYDDPTASSHFRRDCKHVPLHRAAPLQMVLAFFGTTFIVYALMFAGQGDPHPGARRRAAGHRDASGRYLTEKYHLDRARSSCSTGYYMQGPAHRATSARRSPAGRSATSWPQAWPVTVKLALIAHRRRDHLRRHRRRHRRHPPRRASSTTRRWC